MALTRKEMEAELAAGRGILYNGQPITRKEDLPSAASLAKGDPAATAASRADLEAQQALIAAQLAELDGQADDSPATDDKPKGGKAKGGKPADATTPEPGDGAQP